jgi:hypothetical protein
MILPLFFCLSLFSALGVAAVSGLAARMIGGRSLYHVVAYVFVLAAAAALAYGILAKPAIDYSEQKSPATLVSQMIDRIPDGSVVEGFQWKYEKIIDYYRIVEKRDVRFRQGTCDDGAIAEGKCFLLGTETKDQYLRRGYPLGLYLYVEGALPVYQVRVPEPSGK